MGGGLMQLVAYGAQDVYLTGNPQITFFKVVYRRHTNFSMESIRQNFTGQMPNMSTVLSRNGDLIGACYIEHTTSSNTKFIEANKLIDNVECEIGGQLIDRQSGSYMKYYSDLCEYNPTGSVNSKFNAGVLNGQGASTRKAGGDGRLTEIHGNKYIPLSFWFCRNPGLALPLIALQYHEVRINITFRDNVEQEFNLAADVKSNPSLWVDYIYLDTDERRRFAQVSHEYLIEQVQNIKQVENIDNNSSHTGDINLVFNHPVKELFWTWEDSQGNPQCADIGSLANTPNNADFSPQSNIYYGEIEKMKINLSKTSYLLKLNGHDRFTEMPASYFTRVVPSSCHTGGSLNYPVAGISNHFYNNAWWTDYINVYSFALKPEEHQPSGTCNFSRIDNAVLNFNINTNIGDSGSYVLNVHAINYNVLRIMSGMGGLAYSN